MKTMLMPPKLEKIEKDNIETIKNKYRLTTSSSVIRLALNLTAKQIKKEEEQS